MVKIFIDPGHGGADPGTAGNGLQEKNLNLQIATNLRDILINEYEGVTVRMSRTGDQTVSLDQRTNEANSWGADFYLSIHVNAGGGAGLESYIYPGVGAPTTTYQTAIHEEVLSQTNFANRGEKTANFHVLRESIMPAVLTENGFIDNANDASRLSSASFLNEIARGHANGIARAFNLSGVSNPNPGADPDTGSGTLYKVQIGAFRNKANADRLAADAESKGFESIVLLRDGLYKVQIGAFSVRENAELQRDRARNSGYEDAFFYED
ncbi:N-acetylmuramoyl-L-alanine amidase [Mesobacillus harenae]|uniref:N-acetylmuramoyl-L-alanine amidase n=1 Tax=Mesobacillus harenae TaxID=2213203 RepID=UPI00158104AD|nr:N-acetylmuramoyl-L-alanine amidase [Mesobacillus harenae]